MVLQEYTARFFILCKAALKLDAREKLELINIILVPHLKPSEAKSIAKRYQNLISDEKIDNEKIKRDRELLLKKLKRRVL